MPTFFYFTESQSLNKRFKGPAGSAAASPLKPLTNFLGSGLAMQHFVIADLQCGFLVTNREFQESLSAEEGERDPGRISQKFCPGKCRGVYFPARPQFSPESSLFLHRASGSLLSSFERGPQVRNLSPVILPGDLHGKAHLDQPPESAFSQEAFQRV